MHNLTSAYLTAIKRIRQYVKHTIHHGIRFPTGSIFINTISYCDWAGDISDRHSTPLDMSGF